MSLSEPEQNKMKIDELTAYAKRIEVVFKVIGKGEIREITSKKTGESHNLCDIQVGDSTGNIILTLWDADIDLISEDNVYVLSNGYVNVFQNSMRLSKGKYGILKESDEDIDEVNLENNISDKYVESSRPRRSYGGDRGGYRSDRGGYRSDRGGYRSDRGGHRNDRRGGKRW
ncbi:MAG: single-stranded DNA-binding protein [Candidatus Hodarchaeales archaeon]